MAPWGPSLGKDPQERTLLRFHEEVVSGRVLVTLTEIEKAASAGLFPVGGQRRDEVCILWKGLSKHPGPCAKPLFLPRALEVLSGHAGLLGMGNLFASSDCLGAVAAQSVPGELGAPGDVLASPARDQVPWERSSPDPLFLPWVSLDLRCSVVCLPPQNHPALSPFQTTRPP